ncbi:hypothetical protein OHA21_03135 [Actinoplanes sp. NBC_00393]|uniref:rhamnogalacturonan lyase family protein n=1 Tax=Actinoplanes sp. NBC_00393 TaxID=2975953 RepID=UPI002E1D8A0A
MASRGRIARVLAAGALTAAPAGAAPPPPPLTDGKQRETLDRGLISVRSGSGNLVSWRLLATDPATVTFNLYRGTTRIVTGASLTNHLDAGAAAGQAYTVRPVIGGVEQAGTTSGTGQVIGNASADHRNSSGYVLNGPEYLTVLNGQTGAVRATVDYVPPRGTVSSWGDSYGHGDALHVGVHSNNGTKATPSLSGDLLGDWREEVIWPTTDNTRLRIYSTPSTTGLRAITLLHDIQNRTALAWQNTAYNQPPHPSFAIG